MEGKKVDFPDIFLAGLLTPYRLLAIMLGRLRMPLSESRAAFQLFSEKVFDHPNVFSSFNIFRPRYSTKKVTEAIKELVEEKQIDPSRPWKQNIFSSEGDPCRT